MKFIVLTFSKSHKDGQMESAGVTLRTTDQNRKDKY